MAITGIVSARHKLSRARVHIDDLSRRIAAYTDENRLNVKHFWQPSRVHKGEVEVEIVMTGSTPAEVPDEWGLVAGDALTNMRAALDHSLHPHARQFPILKSFQNAQGKQLRLETVFDTTVTALLERYQPRMSAAPDLDPLAILNALVNEDKHHQLLVANNFNARLVVVESDHYEVTHQEENEFDRLSEGDVFTRLRLKPTKMEPFEFAFREYLETEPVINIPKISENVAILDALNDAHSRVSTIVEELAAAGLS
ncbi:hypothetical protein [Nocardia otitidiscaviarum]|uniref:hypothetical protein n=1 Tax=Nocardia otitidiscaviarum TaxID=1823 RepID=UPI002458491A|nr:hypothetical protein [Nocardia otitidiscaviarum]